MPNKPISFNKQSTRKMRRASLQPGYSPSSDLFLALEAGLPVYVPPAK